MTENHADTDPDVMEQFLDDVVGAVDRRTVEGGEAEVYGQNVVSALDAYLSLADPWDTARFHDIGDSKPDVEHHETDLYTIDVPHDGATMAPDDFLLKVNRLRNQFKLLFDTYDEITLSGETGLPLYNEIRQVERDQEGVMQELDAIGDTYARWAGETGTRDRMPSRDWDGRDTAFEATAEWEKDLFWEMTLHSLAEGETEDEIAWPETLAENAQRLDSLRKLRTIRPVMRADYDVDVERSGEKGAMTFTVTVSDFSTVSDDRFLHYEIEAQQAPRTGRRFLGVLGDEPPLREEDEDQYAVSDLFESAITDTVGFTPEQAYENWDALDEVYDVPHGDRIDPTGVTLWKLGPMYTAENAPLATSEAIATAFNDHTHGDMDAVVADSQYDTVFELHDAYEEALQARDPRRYLSMQVGQFLDDNPAGFVFMVETERYREDTDPETGPGASYDTGSELVLATSDAEELSGYIPDAFDGEKTDITTWVVDVPDAEPLDYTEANMQ